MRVPGHGQATFKYFSENVKKFVKVNLSSNFLS